MQKSLERDEMQNSPTPISNQMGVDTEFPLKPGWALKENQKMGNLNPKDRYTAEKMHESLKELAHENELSVEDIPEVKTIKGWIGRYSASSKKEMSEKALEQCALEESSLITNTTHNRASKRQKRG
ncbi:hypothetical protein GLOIN_2v1485655 [Rhizophagus irregularis DAOM 181602=DAOM 197198]|nr:hypothetical protein GLOIN_2v1485655 [Rhizophagus irregularis DAOM 181602=DAOM 197198]